MQVKAQIRSLRRELGRHPWVFARLAELEVLDGQGRRALKRLRAGVRQFPAYASGHQVLGELLLARGEAEEAHRELLLASSCSDSGHAAFELLVEGLAQRDPDAARGLLEEAWSRDRLNTRLRDRMRRAGLIREPEFREILVPTEGERRARDEEIASLIRRLIETVDSPPATPAPPRVTTEPDRQPAGAPPSGLPAAQDEPLAAAQPVALSPAEPSAEPTPPPTPRPPLPDNLPGHDSLFMPRGARSSDGPPRPIRSRALARVYDEQGYLELAQGVIQDLLATPLAAADREQLLHWSQDLERRIAERKP